MHSMAIKINVLQEEQEAISHLLEKAGFPFKRRKFHCTIGFIEKMIPKEDVTIFGRKITELLQDHIDTLSPLYEVEKVEHLFRRVLVFSPTAKCLVTLKELNQWLLEKVFEVSENRWGLNEETIPQNYTPHFTLWHMHKPDSRFKKLEELAANHPIYHLTQAAYVVF
jgi:2'-5' RNA ligase